MLLFNLNAGSAADSQYFKWSENLWETVGWVFERSVACSPPVLQQPAGLDDTTAARYCSLLMRTW